MNKFRQLISKLMLLLLGLILSWTEIISINIVWKNEIFDKFHYKKSISYGYFPEGRKSVLENYGERSKDVINILRENSSNNISNVLGVGRNDIYTIAILGDSYVWGQGLKENDRFAHILETDLNRYTPTKIYSYAMPGDSIFDNYAKYFLLENSGASINLYIIGVSYNDLLFSNATRYGNITERYGTDKILNDQITDCGRPLYGEIIQTTNKSGTSYSQHVNNAYDEKYGNYCLLKKTISLFPKENIIYFNYSDFTYDPKGQNGIIDLLKKSGGNVLDSYQYFKDENDVNNKYVVSKKEGHPSAWANKIFAKSLLTEIISNPKYGFIHDNKMSLK